MTNIFTSNLFSILSTNIPNKTLEFNNKNAPWITSNVKTAIRRKHRVYKKYVDKGRREEDWLHVKEVRNETSKMIQLAKETYYLNQGRKLVDPKLGIKTYWSVLNRLVNKKIATTIPPLLENGLFVTNTQIKAYVLNDYHVEQGC